MNITIAYPVIAEDISSIVAILNWSQCEGSFEVQTQFSLHLFANSE